jgi:hypothetical protein
LAVDCCRGVRVVAKISNFEAAISEVVGVVEAPEGGLQGADGIAYGLDLSLVFRLERSTGHCVNLWNQWFLGVEVGYGAVSLGE